MGAQALARSSLGYGRDRARLIAPLAAIDALNASWLSIQDSLDIGGVLGLILSAGGISAVVWFALYAMIAISRDAGEVRPVQAADAGLMAIMTAAALVPAPLVAACAVLLAAVWLLGSAADRRERRIGLILLALTGPLIWGRLLLEVIAPTTLLRLDAQFVSLLSGMRSEGNVVNFSDGSRFAIAPGCSSLHNMSLAVLMWVTVVQLLDLPPTRRILVTGLLAVFAMLLVNGIRLSAIALLPAHFVLLHTGLGADLFGWTSLILCGVVVLLGVQGVPRRLD
jgi:exosortase/archaeosortase family protein